MTVKTEANKAECLNLCHQILYLASVRGYCRWFPFNTQLNTSTGFQTVICGFLGWFHTNDFITLLVGFTNERWFSVSSFTCFLVILSKQLWIKSECQCVCMCEKDMGSERQIISKRKWDWELPNVADWTQTQIVADNNAVRCYYPLCLCLLFMNRNYLFLSLQVWRAGMTILGTRNLRTCKLTSCAESTWKSALQSRVSVTETTFRGQQEDAKKRVQRGIYLGFFSFLAVYSRGILKIRLRQMGTALFAVFGALIVVFQVRLPLLVNILPSVLNSLTVHSTLSHKK